MLTPNAELTIAAQAQTHALSALQTMAALKVTCVLLNLANASLNTVPQNRSGKLASLTKCVTNNSNVSSKHVLLTTTAVQDFVIQQLETVSFAIPAMPVLKVMLARETLLA